MHIHHSIRLAGILAVSAFLIGCTTARHERPAKAAGSMQEFEKLLSQGATQAERIGTSIDKMLEAKPADVSKAYKQFDKDVEKLRSIGKKSSAEADRMKSLSLKYFKQWEKDIAGIENESLKKMSAERRSSINETYKKITGSMEALGAEYDLYDKELADLQAFIGNDATAIGRDMAKPHLEKMKKRTDAIIEGIGALQAEITGLKNTLRPK